MFQESVKVIKKEVKKHALNIIKVHYMYYTQHFEFEL